MTFNLDSAVSHRDDPFMNAHIRTIVNDLNLDADPKWLYGSYRVTGEVVHEGLPYWLVGILLFSTEGSLTQAAAIPQFTAPLEFPSLEDL